MSYDIFLARPDPSGQTVKTTNPFTGEAIDAVPPSPMDRNELEQLAKSLADAHPNFTAERDEDGWVIADPAGPQTMPYRLFLDPSGGHFELRSPSAETTPERVLEVVGTQLKALSAHGFVATAPGVDEVAPGQDPGPLLRAYASWIGYKNEIVDRFSRDE